MAYGPLHVRASAVPPAILCACAEGAGLPVGGAVAAAAAAAVWPIAWPLAEVSLLAAKSGAQIEADVQLKEPIQVPPACAGPSAPTEFTLSSVRIRLGLVLDEMLSMTLP